MSVEQTLSIIKPDAVTRNFTGTILNRFEKDGFKVLEMKMLHLTKHQASEFYAIHRDRPFFNDLIKFITSSRCVVLVLERENAVLRNRELMGDTNPQNAAEGTIRKDFAESIEANAVHGSDSLENAAIEIQYFFPQKGV